MIAWSWSRLADFEKCPRYFKEKYVTKTLPFVENEAMRRGTRIHKHLERAMLGSDLHKEVGHMRPVVEGLKKLAWDQQLIELEECLDRDKKQVGWFSKKAWVRIKQDFLAKHQSTALAIDWKTGKNYGYSDQLKLYAVSAFLRWSDVDKVRTSYIYVDHNQKEEKLWQRDQLPEMLHDFEDRSERIQMADASGDWPTNPTRNNCRFCEVVGCEDRQR